MLLLSIANNLDVYILWTSIFKCKFISGISMRQGCGFEFMHKIKKKTVLHVILFLRHFTIKQSCKHAEIHSKQKVRIDK